MSDKPQPPRKSRALKFFVASVVGLLIGAGLCGIDAHFYPSREFGGSAFAGWGALLCVISFFLFAGSGLALLGSAIDRLARK